MPVVGLYLIINQLSVYRWAVPSVLSLTFSCWCCCNRLRNAPKATVHVLIVTLTEVVGNVIRDVDVPIGPFAPHAAVAGAGISVFLCIRVDGDVSLDQDGLIIRTDWNKPHRHLHTPGQLSETNIRAESGLLEMSHVAQTHPGYGWLAPRVQTQKGPLLRDKNVLDNSHNSVCSLREIWWPEGTAYLSEDSVQDSRKERWWWWWWCKNI